MRWEATVTEDPWKEIPSPSASQAVNARRVDAELKWDFFWARDLEGHCLLLLNYDAESKPQGHLPKVRGIELTIAPATDQQREMLMYCLADSAQRDIFYKLCRDIVASAASAADERDAVATAVRRTWRWHHLLRGGSDGHLTADEQKGLIGELLVLERFLLSTVDAADALVAWHGPLRAPKDFELGSVCIEVKARRGPAKPFVTINSEYQLDTEGVASLFLYVVELDRAPSDSGDARTVNDIAQRLLDGVVALDQTQGDTLETLLAAAGFRWEDDYSDFKWIEASSHVYCVQGDFPRISSTDLRAGVRDVKYQVSLQACELFEVPADALLSALSEGS